MTDHAPPALDAARTRDTIQRLAWRIAERFPGSGLSGVAQSLLQTADETDAVVSWIERPNIPLRVGIGALIALLITALVAGMLAIDFDAEDFGATILVPLIEAATNELILIGAAVLFLVSIETRAKRRRVIHAINRLRGLAHVVDAHQLTKDPSTITEGLGRTEHSPSRTLKPHELARYLDYCSELLAMTAKLGFLYVQRFDIQVALVDPTIANQAVNELEELTTGLSRKIWQKLMILEARIGGRE